MARTAARNGSTQPKAAPATRSGVPKTLAAYERLRDEITSGLWTPGHRFSELELVSRYGISRTPIRDALVRLEQDGLVERRGSAVHVRERSADEVLDIYSARVWLEGAIAHSAATRRTETDLLRLDAAIARSAAAQSSTPAQFQELNTVFHNALAAASHNLTLQELQRRLTDQVARFPSTTLSYPGRWEVAGTEHRQLVEAIRARNPDEAEEIARKHMQSASDIRLRLMAEELAR